MKKIVGLVLLLIVLFSSVYIYKNYRTNHYRTKQSPAITYMTAPGRFGDSILNYLHAKWVAYHYQLPFFYRPFIYTDRLQISEQEKELTEDVAKQYRKKQLRSQQDIIVTSNKKPPLLFVPYFPEFPEEYKIDNQWKYFKVDWKDKEFRKNVLNSLRIKNFSKKKNKLPTDRLLLAVHIRTGGGFDPANAYQTDPLRFPPLTFYIQQIKKLFSYCEKKKMYLYLFTDDSHPEKIASQLRQFLDNDAIEIDYRKENHHHAKYVLEDFFSMMDFDYLIRPQSNFSLIPSLLKDYRIVISPKHFFIKDRDITIDQINWQFNE